MHYRTLVLTAILPAMLATACSAETLAELKAKMDKFADSFHGTLGYGLLIVGKPDQTINRNGDEVFPTASTIKTTIMVEVAHQVEQEKIKWVGQSRGPAGH